MKHVALAAMIAALSSSAAFAQSTYTNQRFGYSICIPAGLVAQREADNGDGRAFLAADGAKLIVYASHNALDQTLAQARGDVIERLGPASYRAGGADWFVVSGGASGAIYYVRTSLRRGVFTSFELTYPASAAARWNPVAAQLSRCFRAP